jgi:hypothetical protein
MIPAGNRLLHSGVGGSVARFGMTLGLGTFAALLAGTAFALPPKKAAAKPTAPVPSPAAPQKGPAPAPGATPPTVAAPPKASTYEELLTGTSVPADLAGALEPLFAECSKDSDLAYRQCETIKEWSVDRIHHTRYALSGDGAALQSSPYDEAEKSLTLTVTGCVSCVKPPNLDGAPRLVATKAPKGFAEGAPIGLDLGFHEVSIPDAKKAQKWTSKILPRLRVQYVFTVGEPFESGKGDKSMKGISIVPLGHRVYNQCTGEVVASEPASQKPMTIGNRDPSCPAADAPTEEEVAEAAEQAALPDTLSRGDIERAMASIRPDVEECASVLELKKGGVIELSATLEGDGKKELKLNSPYESGEIGLCLRSALKKLSFPKFKKSSKPVIVKYPFVIH